MSDSLSYFGAFVLRGTALWRRTASGHGLRLTVPSTLRTATTPMLVRQCGWR